MFSMYFLQSLSLSITVLLIKHYVWRSVKRSIRVAEKREKENERDKAPFLYTPGSMSESASSKLKKKKEEHPNNVLGALFFPLFQTSSTHLRFLLLINSFSHTPKLSVYQPPSRAFSPLFISVSSLKARLKHSRVSGDCRPLCLHQPPSLLHSPLSCLSSQSCQISRESSGSSVFHLTCSLLYNTLGPKICHGNDKCSDLRQPDKGNYRIHCSDITWLHCHLVSTELRQCNFLQETLFGRFAVEAK